MTVCGGVRIGEGSIIGAGSTVTKDIPAGVIAADKLKPAEISFRVEDGIKNEDSACALSSLLLRKYLIRKPSPLITNRIR